MAQPNGRAKSHRLGGLTANMRPDRSDDAGRAQGAAAAADAEGAPDSISGESADATICRRFDGRESLQEESRSSAKPMAFSPTAGRRARRAQLRSGAKTISAGSWAAAGREEQGDGSREI
jgi:hypothetical protein